jgi:hypothetical protein
MKRTKIIISLLTFTLILFSTSYAQKISVKKGKLDFLKNISELNIEYDFSDFGVGKFKTETAYTDKKVAEYNEDEAGKGDKWLESWNADKDDTYKRKFEELLALGFIDDNIQIEIGDIPNAEYTLILKTAFLEPGYNIGISRKNAYINVEVIFVKTEDKSTPIALMTMDKAPGRGAMGNDYDTGYRIGEGYAKAGKSLAAYFAKKVF